MPFRYFYCVARAQKIYFIPFCHHKLTGGHSLLWNVDMLEFLKPHSENVSPATWSQIIRQKFGNWIGDAKALVQSHGDTWDPSEQKSPHCFNRKFKKFHRFQDIPLMLSIYGSSVLLHKAWNHGPPRTAGFIELFITSRTHFLHSSEHFF